MPSTPFNASAINQASFRLWEQAEREDNSEQMKRLLTNLPIAMQEELTERERQIMQMHFNQNMRVTEIARELGIQKSTVSRAISRATEKLFRALRYSL